MVRKSPVVSLKYVLFVVHRHLHRCCVVLSTTRRGGRGEWRGSTTRQRRRRAPGHGGAKESLCTPAEPASLCPLSTGIVWGDRASLRRDALPFTMRRSKRELE